MVSRSRIWECRNTVCRYLLMEDKSLALTKYQNFRSRTRKLMQDMSDLSRAYIKPQILFGTPSLIVPIHETTLLDSIFTLPCWLHHACIKQTLHPVRNKKCNQIRTKWNWSILKKFCLLRLMLIRSKNKQTTTQQPKNIRLQYFWEKTTT